MIINVIHDFISKEKCQEAIQIFCRRQNETLWWRDTLVLKNVCDNEITEKLKLLAEEQKIVVNYYEIVSWPVGSYQDLHVDGLQTKENKYTSILYLNDDYTGGETIIENVIIKPKTGSLVFFKGSENIHGVNKITSGTRYTVPCWYGYKETEHENIN